MEATNVGASCGTTRDTLTIVGAVAAAAIVAFKLNEERIFSFLQKRWITISIIAMLLTFAVSRFVFWIASFFPDEVTDKVVDRAVNVALKKTNIELSNTDVQLLNASVSSIRSEISKNVSLNSIKSEMAKIAPTSSFHAQAAVGNRTESSSRSNRLLTVTASVQTDDSINSIPAIDPELQASRRLSAGREHDNMRSAPITSELGNVGGAASDCSLRAARTASMESDEVDLQAARKKRRLAAGMEHDDVQLALNETISPNTSDLGNVHNSTDFSMRAALAASMQTDHSADADLQAALESSRRLSIAREYSDTPIALNESGSLIASELGNVEDISDVSLHTALAASMQTDDANNSPPVVDGELEVALQASRRHSSYASAEPFDIDAFQLETALADSIQTRHLWQIAQAMTMQTIATNSTDGVAAQLQSTLAGVDESSEATLLGEAPYATSSQEREIALMPYLTDHPAHEDPTLEAVLAMSLEEF